MYIVRCKITLSALLNEFAEYCRDCQGGSLHEQRGTCWKIRTILTALISRTNRMCRTTWLWCSLSFQPPTRVWWASLTPKTFQTSILCQEIDFSHDGFYSSMQKWHKYDASDFSYLDSLGYGRIIEEAQQERYSIRSLSNFSSLHSSLDCRTDADLDPMAPLCIGMDYNANINWIVCGQPRGNRLNVLRSFYVKFERKIPALIADFCTYYAPHANHSVIY